jgi:hypothetical protein
MRGLPGERRKNLEIKREMDASPSRLAYSSDSGGDEAVSIEDGVRRL